MPCVAAACRLFTSYWQSHGGSVPSWDARKAICGEDSGPAEDCSEFIAFDNAAATMHAAYNAVEEHDSRKSLSVLFNAFIMMQVSTCQLVKV